MARVRWAHPQGPRRTRRDFIEARLIAEVARHTSEAMAGPKSHRAGAGPSIKDAATARPHPSSSSGRAVAATSSRPREAAGRHGRRHFLLEAETRGGGTGGRRAAPRARQHAGRQARPGARKGPARPSPWPSCTTPDRASRRGVSSSERAIGAQKIPSSAGDLCRVGARPVRPSDSPRFVPGRFTGWARVLRKAGSRRVFGTFEDRGRGPGSLGLLRDSSHRIRPSLKNENHPPPPRAPVHKSTGARGWDAVTSRRSVERGA
jgi:hypothetical protein